MSNEYTAPRLHRLGSVATLTGTGCIDLDHDGNGKRIGGPADMVFTFHWGGHVIEIPITPCRTGS